MYCAGSWSEMLDGRNLGKVYKTGEQIHLTRRQTLSLYSWRNNWMVSSTFMCKNELLEDWT